MRTADVDTRLSGPSVLLSMPYLPRRADCQTWEKKVGAGEGSEDPLIHTP